MPGIVQSRIASDGAASLSRIASASSPVDAATTS